MPDNEIQTKKTVYERTESKSDYYDYSTNPVKISAEVQNFSWLDDLGWI